MYSIQEIMQYTVRSVSTVAIRKYMVLICYLRCVSAESQIGCFRVQTALNPLTASY
jgi:hypothetical protein